MLLHTPSAGRTGITVLFSVAMWDQRAHISDALFEIVGAQDENLRHRPIHDTGKTVDRLLTASIGFNSAIVHAAPAQERLWLPRSSAKGFTFRVRKIW